MFKKLMPRHWWRWSTAILSLAMIGFWSVSPVANAPSQKEQLCPIINQVGVLRDAFSSTFSC